MKGYGISYVTGDRYGAEWIAEAFRKQGIHYEHSTKSKSDLFKEFLPQLNSRRACLLDNERLVKQLSNLERRTARGTGRDTIDHPPGEHDDLANCVAGVMVGAGELDWTAIYERLSK